jgi:hypothetical protein
MYHITVKNTQAVQRGVLQLSVDGAAAAGKVLRLISDGAEHYAEVTLGDTAQARS